MKSRNDKLAELNGKQAGKNMVIISDGEPFIAAMQEKVDELKKTLGMGVDFNNLDDLVDKLGTIEELATPVNELRKAIESIVFPIFPSEIDIKNIDTLIANVDTLMSREPSVPVVNLQPLQDVIKRLDILTKAVVANKAVAPGQQPQDFVPMRRVMKVGQTFMYDDSFYTSGGGGGGGQAVPTILYQPIAQGGAGTTAIAGGVAGKRIKVTSYLVVGSGTGTYKFQGNSNDLTGAIPFVANSGAAIGGTEYSPLFQTGVGETLNLVTTGAAGQGHISYYFDN